jgi:hypothetical protein
MIFLVPILVIILIIVAIDHIYFSDTKPKDAPPPKEVHRFQSDTNTTKAYLDRYIKK